MIEIVEPMGCTPQTGTPLRALIWLAAIQRADGSFPQNSWINGTAYWSGLQLDEIAAPILLTWRLHCEGVGLGLFDPCVMVLRAAAYLIRQGPVTAQERWEENAGYSPSRLATVIAGLVCAAELSNQKSRTDTADFIFTYADWLVAHIEDWTVTTCGELVKNIPRHYIRINPTDPQTPDPHADPNATIIQISNGGGIHPARNIVGGDFLQLVRLGIRDANDPIVRDSVNVIDRVLKRELPQGPCWRRYNHDGYGQKENGHAFDGTGTGRSWPILTGEQGHYDLAAGRDPLPFIKALENFANTGGMLSEQLWDADDLPDHIMNRGQPTGAAMPLCWSHAEYISLVRSAHDGVCFDRVEPAFQRYVANPVTSRHEIWSLRHPLRQVPRGKKSCASSSRPGRRWCGQRIIGKLPKDRIPPASTRLIYGLQISRQRLCLMVQLSSSRSSGKKPSVGKAEIIQSRSKSQSKRTAGMRKIIEMSAAGIKSKTAGRREKEMRSAGPPPFIMTIGHSTRTLEEFIGLLKTHGVTRVVDVRTVPRSRHNPQFNKDSLPGELKKVGLGYVHLQGLGGLRHAKLDSHNAGWRNASFRGYADYMQTPEFEESLEKLIQLAKQDRIALMCAEAVPWRCHRSLIADALLVRGIRTEDIMSLTRSQVHALTPFAKVQGTKITYPAGNSRNITNKPSLKRACSQSVGKSRKTELTTSVRS